MERTLVILKPDAVVRGLIGEIFSRFEKKGLKIAALKMQWLSAEILKSHYAHVCERDFYGEMEKFMSSAPVILVVLAGRGAVDFTRQISGTAPDQRGSVRGDFAVSAQRNLIHSSDSVQNAETEISRFFSPSEIFDYPLPCESFSLEDAARNP